VTGVTCTGTTGMYACCVGGGASVGKGVGVGGRVGVGLGVSLGVLEGVQVIVGVRVGGNVGVTRAISVSATKSGVGGAGVGVSVSVGTGVIEGRTATVGIRVVSSTRRGPPPGRPSHPARSSAPSATSISRGNRLAVDMIAPVCSRPPERNQQGRPLPTPAGNTTTVAADQPRKVNSSQMPSGPG